MSTGTASTALDMTDGYNASGEIHLNRPLHTTSSTQEAT